MKYLLIKWRLLLGTVLLVLVLLSLLLWTSPPKQLQDILAVAKSKAKAFPLFYMLDTNTIQYAVDGSVAYQLETVKFDYYEGLGETTEDRKANAYARLEKPLITFYNEKDNLWRLSSVSGESRKNGELVVLMGNVRLWQIQDGITTTELTTQLLTVRPGEALAQTDKPVTANSVHGTMKATGVKLFIGNSKIEFLSEVEGIYDRP